MLAAYTLIHVVVSLVGIATGLVVAFGLLRGRRLDQWTAWFLATTTATSVTGFGFPVDRFLPSHAVGLVSLMVLAIACYARYARRLETRGWRAAYAISAVLALHLNVFVLVVQLFLKVPALNALAPTQTEPPFQITQLAVFVVFAALAAAAVVRIRPGLDGVRGLRLDRS